MTREETKRDIITKEKTRDYDKRRDKREQMETFRQFTK